MTDRELAKHLGKAMEALGKLTSGVIALRDTAQREISDHYYTQDFLDSINSGLEDLRNHLEMCYEAIGGPTIEIPQVGNGDSDG